MACVPVGAVPCHEGGEDDQRRQRRQPQRGAAFPEQPSAVEGLALEEAAQGEAVAADLLLLAAEHQPPGRPEEREPHPRGRVARR